MTPITSEWPATSGCLFLCLASREYMVDAHLNVRESNAQIMLVIGHAVIAFHPLLSCMFHVLVGALALYFSRP